MHLFDKHIQLYFGNIENEYLELLKSFFRPEKLNKGDFFIRSENRCHKLSFIGSGILRCYAQTEAKEVTQWIATQGTFITDLSSWTFDNPSRWNIQALEDTTLLTLYKQDCPILKDRIPRWDELEKIFIAKCFCMLEDRIFSHLSMTAEERYHLFFEHNKDLFNQVPLQYIASMLGMTPETFSRVRKK